jgi:hypothetical protein
MPQIKPQGDVKSFETYLDESDRGWNGVGGLPNNWRNNPDDPFGMEPIDPERAQSGDLSDAPDGRPDAAPGNANPTKF